MSKVKLQILSKVTDILDKFSDRLTSIARQTRQNTDEIAALQDRVRLNVGTLSTSVVDLLEDRRKVSQTFIEVQKDFSEKLSVVKAENDKRENAQALRDQNNVQSLVNLRDSTAKAFTQVRQDVESLLKTIQRLNERVGQVESQNVSLASSVSLISNRTEDIKQKLSASAPVAPTLSHVWVNKKLTGVYEQVDEQEVRIQKLENLLSLYENLRKAQNASVVANGEFLAGPKV